jgi:hypothetical protein
MSSDIDLLRVAYRVVHVMTRVRVRALSYKWEALILIATGTVLTFFPLAPPPSVLNHCLTL